MRFKIIRNDVSGAYASKVGVRIDVIPATVGLTYASLEAFLAALNLTHYTSWKALDDCRKLREVAYPPMADYLDAVAKQSSADRAIADAGLAQEQAYKAACLAVKAKYPKPV